MLKTTSLDKNFFNPWQKWETFINLWQLQCRMRCKINTNIELANISNAYSATNTMKFDILNDTRKHLLWKQNVAYHCNRHTAAPISDFESEFFGNKSNEKVYIDLQDSPWYTDEIEKLSRNDSKLNVTIELKNALTKKMRLRVWEYTIGEYL